MLSVAGVHILIDSACGLEVLELGLWGFWGQSSGLGGLAIFYEVGSQCDPSNL